MNAPVAFLLLAPLFAPSPPAPTQAQVEQDAQDDASAQAELLGWLEVISEMTDQGELDLAREELAALVESEEYPALLSLDAERVTQTLLEIDRAASRLSAVSVQSLVREERLRVFSANRDEDDPELLAAMQNLAITRYGLGDLPGTLELEERVHAARERLLPAEHAELLAAKGNLAVTRKALGDLQGALELETHVLEVLQRTRQAGDTSLLVARENLAGTLRALGRLSEANEMFEAALAGWEKNLPADHVHVLRARSSLAVTRRELGDPEAARELEESVLAIRERLLPREHAARLASMTNLAITLRELGEWEEALALLEELVPIQAARLPPEHPELMHARQNLAGARLGLGDLKGAYETYASLHELCERSLPPGDVTLLDAKQNLASTLLTMGQVERAHEYFSEVYEARARLLEVDHPQRLAAKGNLAMARAMRGDLEGALELQRQVHDARARLLHAEHTDLLLAKLSLAATLRMSGETAEALKLFEAVYEVRTRTRPPGHPERLDAMTDLAIARQAEGDTSGALELKEEVHAVREELLVPGHPDLLDAKMNLAVSRVYAGDLKGGLALQQQVHESWSALPGGHPSLSDLELNMAVALCASGEVEAAKELVAAVLRRQIELAGELRDESARVARSRARSGLRRLSAAFSLEVWDESSSEQPMLELAFAGLEGLRSVSVASSEIARATVGLEGFAELREELARVRAELGDLGQAGPDEGVSLDAWRGELATLAETRDALQREVRAGLVESGLATELPDPASVAAGLSPGAVFVSYFVLEGAPFQSSQSAAPTEPRFIALIVTPDARVRRVELGAGSSLDELVMRWRASLGVPVATNDQRHASTGGELGSGDSDARTRGVPVVRGVQGEEPQLGHALRAAVLDRCLARLDQRPARLHLVLDASLHLVPWDSLPWDSEGDDAEAGRRIGDLVPVHVESSALRLCRAPHADPSLELGTFVALGGAAFDSSEANEDERLEESLHAPAASLPARQEARSEAPSSFDPIPGSLEEVEELGRLYLEIHGRTAVLLTGAEASKPDLLREVGGAAFLHLATHGWFRSQDSLIDRRDQGSTADRAWSAATVRDLAPEVLCGLALSGANGSHDADGHRSGVLTAEELAGLDLTACELAVLSACETNVGLRQAGQGIHSLQAALHAAGARTAVTSLWRVNDESTRELMGLFYSALWREGCGPTEALWRAKRAMRDAGHDPRDWAGWVATGEPD